MLTQSYQFQRNIHLYGRYAGMCAFLCTDSAAWVIFLKNNGMLGDDIQEMEAEEFSETELYASVFAKKTGKNAKEKMNW